VRWISRPATFVDSVMPTIIGISSSPAWVGLAPVVVCRHTGTNTVIENIVAVTRNSAALASATGADVLARFFDDPCALVDLAALLVMRLTPSGERNDPVVESLAALAERVLLALVRAGDESVRRDRDVTHLSLLILPPQ
jgi:hypothetical protein